VVTLPAARVAPCRRHSRAVPGLVVLHEPPALGVLGERAVVVQGVQRRVAVPQGRDQVGVGRLPEHHVARSPPLVGVGVRLVVRVGEERRAGVGRDQHPAQDLAAHEGVRQGLADDPRPHAGHREAAEVLVGRPDGAARPAEAVAGALDHHRAGAPDPHRLEDAVDGEGVAAAVPVGEHDRQRVGDPGRVHLVPQRHLLRGVGDLDHQLEPVRHGRGADEVQVAEVRRGEGLDRDQAAGRHQPPVGVEGGDRRRGEAGHLHERGIGGVGAVVEVAVGRRLVRRDRRRLG
jgi:hypothetical protein